MQIESESAMTASTRQPGSDDSAVQLLCVTVAGQRCALPAEVVVALHAAVQLTPLPGAPDVVAGLVNRYGRMLPVLDLRRRLGLASRPVQVDDRLVVLRMPGREVALLVDAAVDMLEIPTQSVDTAAVTASPAMLSRGVAVLPDGLLVILDVTAFLSPVESSALDEALQQALAEAAG